MQKYIKYMLEESSQQAIICDILQLSKQFALTKKQRQSLFFF